MSKHLVRGSIILDFDAEVDDPNIFTAEDLARALGVYFPALADHLLHEDTLEAIVYDFQPNIIIHDVRDGSLDSIEDAPLLVDEGNGVMSPVMLGVQNTDGNYTWVEG